MNIMKRIRWCCLGAVLLGGILGSAALADPVGPAPSWATIAPEHVVLEGELGRRRDLQKTNLLVFHRVTHDPAEGPLDFEHDLLRYWGVGGPRLIAPEFGRALASGYSAVGKALVGLIHYAAYDGDADLVAKKNRYLDALIATQDPDGYLGLQAPLDDQDQMYLFRGWNIHDGTHVGLALVEDYRLFGRETSLAAARRYADLLIARWNEAGDLTPLGIEIFMLKLSEATGDPQYRQFVAETPLDGRFIEKASLLEWNQELYPYRIGVPPAKGWLSDQKVHTYRYFSRLLDQLHLYRQQPDPRLLRMSRSTVGTLFDSVGAGLYASGAVGRSEGWVEDQIGTGGVGEGCAVVHVVWWLDTMIRLDQNLKYGDAIERTLYNHIYGAQDPVSGQTHYMVSLRGPRSFNKGAHCCEGNYMRFWSDVQKLVAYRTTDGLAVSLYTPSSLTVPVGNQSVTLTQLTDYPASGAVSLSISPEQSESSFTLRLRIPRWAKTYRVAVNGQAPEIVDVPGGIGISRVWRQGDRVTLEMPMELRWITGLKANRGYAVLARGPQLFGLALDRNPGLKDFPWAKWREITIDPESVNWVPTPTQMGVHALYTVRAKAWLPGQDQTRDAMQDLILTDFTDPNSQEIYFRIKRPSVLVADELLSPMTANE